MKQKLSVAISLPFLCGLLGCATADYGWGNRFYSGAALPKNEIALVFATNNSSICDIREETEKEERVFGYKMVGWGPWDMLDLVPGRYLAGFIYSRSTAGTTYEQGARVQLELNVQAGNIYVIYPEIIRETDSNQNTDRYGRWVSTSRITKEAIKKWRPIVVHISDYSKEDCAKKCGALDSCYEKEKILELATKYLQSERRIMHYRPFEKPITNIWTQRPQNGVWR